MVAVPRRCRLKSDQERNWSVRRRRKPRFEERCLAGRGERFRLSGGIKAKSLHLRDAVWTRKGKEMTVVIPTIPHRQVPQRRQTDKWMQLVTDGLLLA